MKRQNEDIFTAAGFFEERQDYLRVTAAPSESGDGFDVVLRVDGTYDDLQDADDAAEGIRDWIRSLKDVPNQGRTWWAGPPYSIDAAEPRPHSHIYAWSEVKAAKAEGRRPACRLCGAASTTPVADPPPEPPGVDFILDAGPLAGRSIRIQDTVQVLEGGWAGEYRREGDRFAWHPDEPAE